MKRKALTACIGILIVGLFWPAMVAAQTRPDESLMASIDEMVSEQMEKHQVTAAAVAIVQEDRVLLQQGYGVMDLETREAVSAESSLFRIGSTSKLFTFTALMQQIEKGTIGLHEAIEPHLDFELPAASGDSDEAITPYHLMTHTAGFEDIGEGLFVARAKDMTSLETYVKNYRPQRVFEPGKVMAYSNYGSALAGYLVQKLSGMPFAEYANQNLFLPLGMDRTTFAQPLPPGMEDDFVQAYFYRQNEPHAGHFEYNPAYPAGSATSTAADMAVFMQEALRGQTLLSENARQTMQREAFRQHPLVSGMALGYIEAQHRGHRILTHGGDTHLFHSGLFLVPSQDLGLFIVSSGNDLDRMALSQKILDLLLPFDGQDMPTLPPERQEPLSPYVGDYGPNRMNFSSHEKIIGMMQQAAVRLEGDTLTLHLYGQQVPLRPLGEGLFLNASPESPRLVETVAFVPDASGAHLLAFGGPMTYAQLPWHGRLIVHLVAIGGSLALHLIFLLSRAWGTIRRLRKGEKEARAVRRLKILSAVSFGLNVAFLAAFASMLTREHPGFGVPAAYLGLDLGHRLILAVPWLIAALWLLLTGLTGMAFAGRQGTLKFRLVETVLRLAGLVLLLSLASMNLLHG